MQKNVFNGQLSPIVSMPWWVAAGSQDEQGNSCNLNQIGWIEHHQKSGSFVKSQHVMGQAPEKEKEAVFELAFLAGEKKYSLKENDMHDHQTNFSQQFSQQKSFFELELGQPRGCVMLPCYTEDGPTYVNPKQYHGILRRRKMRAKEGLKNRSTRDKPYLHESRHSHACRRPRGPGGRFLNTKSLKNEKSQHETEKTSDEQAFPSSQSSSSEVLQSDSGNLNFLKEVSDCKRSNLSSSEVTSTYYSEEFDSLGVNPGRPFTFHPLSNLEGSRQGGSSWIAAADDCCNFFKI